MSLWAGSVVIATARSAPGAATTEVACVPALLDDFGSGEDEATLAVLAIDVPPGVPELTRSTRLRMAVASAARLGIVAETAPVPPTGGVVAAQPAGLVRETNVVPAGRVSSSLTAWAAPGPRLVMVT